LGLSPILVLTIIFYLPFNMATAAVFGCTGAVGSHILSTLLNSDAFISVKTISRRLPKSQSPKLEASQEADISKWGGIISNFSPKPSVVFNAVGTTRAAAGGIQNQWKIDHDLCVENAKAVKEAGVKTYVFISSAGTRGLLSIYVPYSKMKVGVEDAIKELDFEQAIILRPGMIIGERETPKAPFLEKLIGNLHKISPSFQDLIGMPVRLISSPSCGTKLNFRSGPEDHRKGGGGGCAPCAGGQGALQVLGPRAGRYRQVWQR
jgi:nucleoside-diphosphate-sugar epimerase